MILIHWLWVGLALVRLVTWEQRTSHKIFWLVVLVFTPIPFVTPLAFGIASYLPKEEKRKRKIGI